MLHLRPRRMRPRPLCVLLCRGGFGLLRMRRGVSSLRHTARERGCTKTGTTLVLPPMWGPDRQRRRGPRLQHSVDAPKQSLPDHHGPLWPMLFSHLQRPQRQCYLLRHHGAAPAARTGHAQHRLFLRRVQQRHRPHGVFLLVPVLRLRFVPRLFPGQVSERHRKPRGQGGLLAAFLDHAGG